jgi:hypothetical protein
MRLVVKRGSQVLQVLDHWPIHSIDRTIGEDCTGDVAPRCSDCGDCAMGKYACYRLNTTSAGASRIVDAWKRSSECAIVLD